MKATEKEFKVLRAIATNCFNHLNYGTPEVYEDADAPIWSAEINDAGEPSEIEGLELSGVCGSLARKGFVGTHKDRDGETIWLTEEGFAAYKEHEER